MGVLRDDKSKEYRLDGEHPSIDDDQFIVYEPSLDESLLAALSLSDESDSSPADPAPCYRSQRRAKRRQMKKLVYRLQLEELIAEVRKPIIKKNMGAHKWRRVEQERFLAQFAESVASDYTTDSLDITNRSGFACIYENPETLRCWYEFIEKDDEEQQRIVDELFEVERRTSRRRTNPKRRYRRARSVSISSESDQENASEFACSVKSRLLRLEAEFRNALFDKDLAILKFIEETEIQLRNFFGKHSNGIMSLKLSTRKERFYLHAVCRFLMLQSESKRSEGQVLVTTVKNGCEHFHPPKKFLYAYLHKKIAQLPPLS